ncbi:MAG: small multi-drug export protein [Candidatus Omnitrophica bacterium]|nr:small multi-drug export protein [Candidatus Omnitrophota bacterium]MDD5080432.1 small multi-drug export protein [Candidatus Omnitrophota bacterium]MDD5441028.1 small multi-drug export protein [Candidatus Omnitrophota bacterium]
MKTAVVLFLQGIMPEPFMVFFLGALPIFELRLAIPLGVILFDMPYLKTFLLAFLGNISIIFPLLLLWRFMLTSLELWPGFIGNIIKWWFARVDKRTDLIRKWGFWGLVCFVAVPLPVTGAWTGTVAASLLGMKYRDAFMAIVIGVIMAGFVVSVLTFFGVEIVSNWINF